MRVKRVFDFEAAHVLPHHPGKCARLHGHSYRLAVIVDRPVDPGSGLAIDFGELKTVVNREAVDALDHRHLNDFIDNPSAEHIAVWIWRRLSPALAGLVEIELWETRRCAVIYRGE